ncbi:hypothetical protein SteCoe_5399 [Stentor coeruleus]|uniref:Protein kinase domain-containing protein n=1 Tax=Stentor coeruleus TaxID=5963 RepID=A0A1R2CSI0_9CILI|nr:hypothetical protein SteCoe_5399 [Stentor coeruleus]
MGNILICTKSAQDSSFESKPLSEFENTFTLGSLLGIGQFSEVRVATGSDGSKVAVKCVNFSYIKNEPKMIKREISIVKSIKHSNIVQVYEIYEGEFNLYLTMELCSKGSLKERVKLDGPVSIQEVKIIAKKLLEALDYLHSKKICHRDVKPENILFTEDNVKIADFGLARLMNGTNKFTMVGTPYYISPEIIAGVYNTKCDIWSLGVVLFFALTSRLPFHGESFEDLFERISDQEIDWHGVEEPEENFLRYLMNKNQKLRPSATEALTHPWLNLM